MGFLSEREPDLREKMDDPDCDINQLRNTYRYFYIVNKLVSGWNFLFRSEILPLLKSSRQPITILDVGCGGGDLSAWLWKLSDHYRQRLSITGVDIDERAISFAKQNFSHRPITFRTAHTSDLVADGEQYDLVISNHLLHHLSQNDLTQLIDDAEQLATRKVLFNDIERSKMAYYSFSVITRPFFPHSFIREDGLTSIRRSYRRKELVEELPSEWEVVRPFPFRITAKRLIA